MAGDGAVSTIESVASKGVETATEIAKGATEQAVDTGAKSAEEVSGDIGRIVESSTNTGTDLTSVRQDIAGVVPEQTPDMDNPRQERQQQQEVVSKTREEPEGLVETTAMLIAKAAQAARKVGGKIIGAIT